MTDAPKRIWIEYHRADLSADLVRAAYASALEDVATEADSWSDEMIHANDIRNMPEEPSDAIIAAIIASVLGEPQ